MYIVRKYHHRIDRFICSESRGAFFVVFALLVVVLAFLGALLCRIGAPAMNGYAWDSPVYLDGAWRIACGQAPHRDFYTFIGVLPFYLAFLGMKLSRPCVSAITYGNIVLMAALVLPAITVLRRRTSGLPAFLYTLFIALLVVTPRALGNPYDYIDHAMLYNRYGEAFLALLGMILFLPMRPELGNRLADGAESVLAGFLLIALLGCKVNYFVVGIVFFVVASGAGRFRGGRAAMCVFTATAFLCLALFLTKIPLAGMLGDYRIMAGCQSLALKLRAFTMQGVKSIWVLPVLLLLVWEGFEGETEHAGNRTLFWRQALVVVVIYSAAVLLLSSNSQIGEMPLLALAALYGFEIIRRQTGATVETAFFPVVRRLLAFLLALLFLLPAIVDDLKTIRFVTHNSMRGKWVSTEALKSTSLNDFRFVQDGTRLAEMRDYREALDDGIQLLRRHSSPEMRLSAFLFSNPFHVALGLNPASGGLACLADMGLVRQSHPPLSRLLGNATHILTDRGCQELRAAYGAEWDALNLKVVEESKYYSLFDVQGPSVGQSPKTDSAGTSR